LLVLHPLLGPIGQVPILIYLSSFASPTSILTCFASSTSFANPTPILVYLTSYTNWINHARNHLHDPKVIFNDNVVELSDY